MSLVTIPGAGTTITGSFGNDANFQLAKQIRDALVAAGNDRITTAVTGGGVVPGPPSNTPAGGVNELVINGPGSYTIPAGSAGAPDYVVVVDPTVTGVTIHGAANSTILGGNVIVDPALIVVPEEAGDAKATISGLGDVLAGNNHNDILTATDHAVAGSISGGTHTNIFFDRGSNDTISARGFQDTIFGGPNSATIQLLDAAAASTASGGLPSLPGARKALVVGGSGGLTVTDAGTGDTISGGDGVLNVTTSGTFARVIGGELGGIRALDTGMSDTIFAGGGGMFVTLAGASGAVVGQGGKLTVIDNGTGTAADGTNNAITAGSGITSVTAATSSTFVQGGAGLLNFVGGTGNSTIMGGPGKVAVTGGGGATSLFGGAGGSISYRNITDGNVSYTAGIGDETINASQSGGRGLYVGGLDTAGHNLMMAGAGADTLNAGSGAATLFGGGVVDVFNFFASLGGAGAVNAVIADWSPTETVRLLGYAPGTGNNAVAGATTAGGSTTVTLSDNTKITFTGLTDPAALMGHLHI